MPQKSTFRFFAALILVVFYFLRFQNVFAYDEETTHPAITDEIVDFYNSFHPGAPFTAEEKEWIIQGSILEDTPPRWINHFYDPVTKVSWTGENIGNISPDAAVIFRALALSPEPPLTAVEWVNNQLIQDEYSRYGGNRTWKRGLQYYANGSAKEAYVTLGHVLHLLEDMTVPEHTRNDPHAHDLEKVTGDYGSPYEEYTKKWTRDNLNIAKDLKREGLTPPTKSSIEEYLISVAEYSNHYFFSKDTINNPKNPLPKIVREDENFGYGIDEEGIEFPLVRIDRIWDQEKNEYELKYLLEKNEPAYHPILDAYFSRLSRQAVLNGAGVIDLFQKQAKDAVVNKEFPQHLVVYDTSKITLPVVSLFGEAVKVWNALALVVSGASQMIHTAISSIANWSSSFQSGGANISSSFGNTAGSANVPLNANDGVQNSFLAAGENILPAASGTSAVPSPLISDIPDTAPSDPFYEDGVGSSTTGDQAPATSTQNENIFSFGGGPSTPQSDSGQVGSGQGGGGVMLENTPVSEASATGAGSSSAESSAPSSSVSGGGVSSSTNESPENPYHFRASYVSSSMAVFLDWDAPTSTEAGSSTTRYALSELSGATSTFLGETTSTSFTKTIDTVGVSSTFLFAIYDDAGAETATTSASVWIPSFLDAVRFSRDPRVHTEGGRSASSTHYLVDIFYSAYPFIPEIFSSPTYAPAWQGLVFYVNRLPNKDNGILNDGGVPIDDGVLSFRRNWTNVGVIFGLSPERSNGIGGGLNNSTILLPSEDGHLAVSPASSTDDVVFSPSDYITVAYYDFSRSGGGHQDLSLVAVDNTKYYFENNPFLQSPNPPANISATFDPFYSRISIVWASSTDPDSPDAAITYQFQVATSSVFDAGGWQSTGNALSGSNGVVFGNVYMIDVRAVDDFGNASAPNVTMWDFPDGFTPLPAQPNHSDFVGLSNGNGQKIVLSRDAVIDAVAFWIANHGGPSCCTETYLEIRSDTGGIPGDIIATSTLANVGGFSSRETLYFFDDPVDLSGSVSYWLIPIENPLGTNRAEIFGSAGDSYADGFWSDAPAADAYFRLREAP